MFRWMFGGKVTKEEFLQACQDGDLAKVNQYIQENKDVPNACNVTDSKSFTALMIAVAYSNSEVVRALLQVKDININQTIGKDNHTAYSLSFRVPESAAGILTYRYLLSDPRMRISNPKALLTLVLNTSSVLKLDNRDKIKELLNHPPVKANLSIQDLNDLRALEINKNLGYTPTIQLIDLAIRDKQQSVQPAVQAPAPKAQQNAHDRVRDDDPARQLIALITSMEKIDINTLNRIKSLLNSPAVKNNIAVLEEARFCEVLKNLGYTQVVQHIDVAIKDYESRMQPALGGFCKFF